MNQSVPVHPVTILDYWRLIWHYRMMIALLVVGSVLVTGVMGKFFSVKRYEAKATFFPAKETGGGGGMSLGEKDKGGGSMAMEVLGGSKSGPNVLELLHGLLMSRTIAELVIKQLNLMDYYGTTSLPVTVGILRGEVDVRASPFKSFEVTVLTRDPKVAAEIANAFVGNLDHLNKELTVAATKRNRLFIEQRLDVKTRKLQAAEEALKAFQTDHRTLAPKEQHESALETVADLHSKIVGYEVELAALKEYANPNHPQITQLQAQIQELRKQLDKLEQEEGIAPGKKPGARQRLSQKAFPFFEEAPGIYLEHLRLARQVKVEEAVYGMLVGMLEQAKIAEVKDVPTIQVVDVAVPPEVHSRPKTLENVQIAGVISLIFGILLALFLNHLEQIKGQERVRAAEQVVEIPVNGAAEIVPDANGNGSKIEAHLLAPKEKESFPG